jgi:hypothetical protein
MNTIYGLFPSTDSAKRAVRALREAGPRLRFGPDRIAIISPEPLDERELGVPRQRTMMPWIAALGGICGGTAGYSLVAFTQRTYPLPTGGMPIVALWPAGIITYEFTMLGAILTTAITFLVTSGLPNFRRRLYDPEVSSGKILVGVSDADVNSWTGIEETLYEQGAERVKQYSTA